MPAGKRSVFDRFPELAGWFLYRPAIGIL